METLEKRLDGLLTSELGKDVKTNPDTITALRNSFMETNKVEVVDPMNVKKMAKELEEEIDSFESNVDWVLSEANGKTMIEV
jgi:pyrrolidone-carboxylate peptidase